MSNVCPESPGWGELNISDWKELDADRWRSLVNGTAGGRAIVYAGHEPEPTVTPALDKDGDTGYAQAGDRRRK
ncbi:MAG: hypothetical protein WBA57_21285 [Elainellaceae cyanobacterium]